jgi:N-acetylated-alpha-linked acidic dipeptidase
VKRTPLALLLLLLAGSAALSAQNPVIFGFRDAAPELALEKQFLAVPDAQMAAQHLKILTAAPHVAGSPEDRQTAEYVAQQFRAAGLETEIVEYKVWMNRPKEISVSITAPPGVVMQGPTREHVNGDDPFQDDPRILPAFSGSSPSGDVEAEVVYANYGRPEDLNTLKDMGIDVRGKILLVRYGENFRGVKAFVAQENGAAGVILYSDPIDDGWFKGDVYPLGPWRPESSVQRGSIGYIFEFPGDPTTPGVASTPDLSEAQRVSPQDSAQMPKVPATPLSSQDARPILEHLGGLASPREWQGALPFTYHLGPGPVRVHLRLKQDYRFWSIWDVIGTARGTQDPGAWTILGNHRDAWVYGAADPGSGTAALLETVRGVGALLHSGWRPKRTMIFASWDAEEEGLIGSTEWAEQNAEPLANAVAYFNTDVAVSGPNFVAAAVPSLKQFLRDAGKAVPSPKGNTLYDAWLAAGQPRRNGEPIPPEVLSRMPVARTNQDAPVGDLGSGSDYTVFLQHLGIPAADISSAGPYGVYHSAFDDFIWFQKFADPKFLVEQQQARLLGISMLRMAGAEVLPYDYEEYGREIQAYLEAAQERAKSRFPGHAPDFAPALRAASRLTAAGVAAKHAQADPKSDPAKLNPALRQAEREFLLTGGLPNRPWYKHAIYAPGEYTGYAAVVIPGVNEAIGRNDLPRTQEQLRALTAAIERAAQTLEYAANGKQ